MTTTELLLIDLSALAHQIWHVSGNEPDPSFVSTQIIARVRALASAHPVAAICCDSGKSFRCEIDPTYKAQRDTENRAPLKHQMDVACETLRADGFPVWAVAGFEADDLIASATREALAIPDTTVLIASNDKDLLQLVNARVSAKNLTTGNVVTPADVVAKFGVQPAQMLDYLCLVGDASDNVKGADGIGPVTAAAILKKFVTLEAFYVQLEAAPMPPDMKRRAKFLAEHFGIGDKQREALQEFRARWPTVRSLLELRTDVPLPFVEVAVERTAKPMTEEAAMGDDEAERELSTSDATNALNDATAAVKERIAASDAHAAKPDGAVMAYREAANNAATQIARQTPVDYSQQLEPRTMPEAVQLAQRMYESRLFSAYGTPQAVLATVLAGRELGMPAMASLRAFHIIEGKPTMAAGTIAALILRTGHAQYFRCSERTAERATFVTKRGDDPEFALSVTIAEARQAFGFDQPMQDKDRAALETKWQRSGWGKNPADMLVARASSKLARLVYPDVVSGLYAPEEFD